jgi:hypothetical protein
LQTNNTLFLGDTTFVTNKEQALKEAGFLAKPHKQLTTNHPVKFNSSLIQLNNSAVALTQEQQCSNLQLVGESKTMSSSRGTICQNLTIKEQYIA